MSTDELLARFVRETHSWIDTDSPFFVAVSTAIRTQLTAILADINALPEWQSSGVPLHRLAESWQLYPSSSTSDSNVLELLRNVYLIHTQRGTLPGISFDIEVLLNHTPNLVYREDLEWYLGVTFPGQEEHTVATGSLPDNQGVTSLAESISAGRYNTVAWGIDTGIFVQYFNDTNRSDTEVQSLIVEKFIPPRVAVEFDPQTELPAPGLMFELEDPSFELLS